jgi:hypothetical protein
MGVIGGWLPLMMSSADEILCSFGFHGGHNSSIAVAELRRLPSVWV